MQQFGTMADFDALLKGMHERELKLVMDLVVNHSSDQHEWFKQSRSSRDNPYRNYYHWWPAEKGQPAHRYSFFDVTGEAWKYDSLTNAYYLHYFGDFQPDLNWENPKLREEIFNMMKFWFNKGVDGFRMDVIPFISKDTTFPPLPAAYNGDFVKYYAHGPHLHEYLQQMHKDVLSKYVTAGFNSRSSSSEAAEIITQNPLMQSLLDQAAAALHHAHSLSTLVSEQQTALVERARIYAEIDAGHTEAAGRILERLSAIAEKTHNGFIQMAFHGAAGAVLTAQGKYEDAIGELLEDDRNPYSLRFLIFAYQKTGEQRQANRAPKEQPKLPHDRKRETYWTTQLNATGKERRTHLVHADAQRHHLEHHRDGAADRFQHDRRLERRPERTDQQQGEIDFGHGEDLIGDL